ncbi:uncharacterized protein TM35_000471660 [Trypanosoma theileri]|uniref:Mucin TcMUCII n=1 Tax=Trypanosoma theileri TaxID=67003 RepID=A0A1X0NI55_9TRYP|nr:uncharacterized protein TM35_000471660 [Trypanosoma theileri]ORC84271.1 hypothetical protein TM35_000471660 [Trypanosoma theileri]
MREMMRHVVCLLVLMLCCAYGCVSATPLSTITHPTKVPLKAAGPGIGSAGPKLDEPREYHSVGDKSRTNCPSTEGQDGTCVAAIPGRVGPPTHSLPGAAVPGPQNALGGPHSGTGVARVKVDNKTGCPVKNGKVIPCRPCEAGVDSTVDAPCVPTATLRYHGVAESYGEALKDNRDTVITPKRSETVQRTEDGHTTSLVTQSPEESLLSRPATVGNRNHTKVNTTDAAAAAVPGNPNGVPSTDLGAVNSDGHTGVPGASTRRAKHDVGVTVHPATPVSNTADGQPKFPGVDPKVAPAAPDTNYPGVNQTLLHVGGAPSVAINRGPARPPRVDVDSPPADTPEVSQSNGETSGPTNTHNEENDIQTGNTAAPSQSESSKNTPNTPTKVTPPAIPTKLQPPMPAKSETKPPKKRKADSSSMSSVWVRVPLLIVVVLFSATVY